MFAYSSSLKRYKDIKKCIKGILCIWFEEIISLYVS